MKKQKLASEIFKENVKEIFKKEAIEKNPITTGKLIREIGQGCFNCAPTNIWGKTGLKEKTRNFFIDASQSSAKEKMSLLEDEKIESSNGLLVLGYGDAENNGWYGAGPTRDMRRAYYTPMLLAIKPEANLGRKTFFSNKFSDYTNQFADALDSLNFLKCFSSPAYLQDNYSRTLVSGILKVSDKENAGFEVFAANKKIFEKNYFCDLGVLLKFGNFSGHMFLPPEARNGSPLYGPLSLAMNGKENLMQGPVKNLYEFLHNCYAKFGAVVDNFPIQENLNIYPLVFVDNS